MHLTRSCIHLRKSCYFKGKIKSKYNCLCELFKPKIDYRFERLKDKDVNFETRFNHLGSIAGRNGVTEFNWDGNLEDSNEH